MKKAPQKGAFFIALTYKPGSVLKINFMDNHSSRGTVTNTLEQLTRIQFANELELTLRIPI